jgi:hypothetical protein
MNVPAELLDLRFSGGGHVESFFLKANEPSGRRAIWVRATVFARPRSADPTSEPVPPLASAWAIAFDRERGHVAAKTDVPLAQARFARGAFDVAVDGCELSLGRARGAVETAGRALGWDLVIGPPRCAPIVHLPSPALYRASVPPSKAVTPVADARLEGVFRVRRGAHEPEETWDVGGWPAMLGHNWGPGHPHLYAWTHCNTWDDAEDLVFEGASARVRVGPLLSPMATVLFVRWRGESFDLNAREVLGTNRGLISLRRWEATSLSPRGPSLKVELSAETDDFVGLHYPNPRGAMTHCLNTKLARARLELSLPAKAGAAGGRGAGGPTLVAHSRCAALELGTREPRHGVRMYL